MNYSQQSNSQDKPFLDMFDDRQILRDFYGLQSQKFLNQNKEQGPNMFNQEMQIKQQQNVMNQNYVKYDNNKSKQKKKVFYRDKMASLLKQGQYVKQEYNYVAYSLYNEQKQPISKDQQLKRNRESAKNSRQRKKQYVQTLQKRNQQNLKQIQELKQKIQRLTLQRDRLRQSNHLQITNFLKSQAAAYQNLHFVIQNHSSDEEMKRQIDDIVKRFGTSGTQRMSVINYYMNQIIQSLVSDIHKYFINSSAFSQGLSMSLSLKPVDQQVMKILDLDVSKISTILLKYRQRFQQQSGVFKGLTQQFYRIFKSIENQGKIIQNVFKEMIKQLDIAKVGKLILWFQQNKFNREVKRIRKQWNQQLKTGQEVIQTIRKQIKT